MPLSSVSPASALGAGSGRTGLVKALSCSSLPLAALPAAKVRGPKHIFVVHPAYGFARDHLLSLGWAENPDQDSFVFDLKWCLRAQKVTGKQVSGRLSPEQIVSHFRGSEALVTKHKLAQNLRYAQQLGFDVPNHPRTYTLGNPGEVQDFIDDFVATFAQSVLRALARGAVPGAPPGGAALPGQVKTPTPLAGEEDGIDCGPQAPPPALASAAQVRTALDVARRRLEAHEAAEALRRVAATSPTAYIRRLTSKPAEPLLRSSEEWMALFAQTEHRSPDFLPPPPRLRRGGPAGLGASAESLPGLPLPAAAWGANGVGPRLAAAAGRRCSGPTAPAALAPPMPGAAGGAGGAGGAAREEEEDAPLSAAEAGAARELVERLRTAHGQFDMDGLHSLWLLKACCSSRGRYIGVFHDLASALRFAHKLNFRVIAQKYVEDLLCARNRKIDMRQWVLVTSWNPLTTWVHQEPYFRVCLGDFDITDLDVKKHLSNATIQESRTDVRHEASEEEDETGGSSADDDVNDGGDIGHDEEPPAHEKHWSLAQFKAWLEEVGFGSKAWEDTMWPDVCKAVSDTLYAAHEAVEHRHSSFQLFGFDFLFSRSLKLYLLEVNSSPSMSVTCSAPLSRMVLQGGPALLDIVLATHRGEQLDDVVGPWLRLPRPRGRQHRMRDYEMQQRRHQKSHCAMQDAVKRPTCIRQAILSRYCLAASN